MRGGGEAGDHIFLVFVAGITKMGVHVDEAGHEQQAVGLEDLTPFREGLVSGRGHGEHASAPDEQVHRGVKMAGVFDAEGHD